MSDHSLAALQQWLREELARVLQTTPDRIEPRTRFQSLGLDSARATALSAKLGSWLGRPLPITLVWDHPTIDDLARFLTQDSVPTAASPTATDTRRTNASSDEPIALVGIGCRFPGGVDSPASFWRALLDSMDGIVEVPKERWEVRRYLHEDRNTPGKMNTRWGGFLQRVDEFDALFFGVSPREATQMDPQQRLSLECAWEALEDAGIRPENLLGSPTGVFMGAMWSDYAHLMGDARQIVQHTATGQDTSIIPARVSYSLGLQGPSIAINTACSSSLVAVRLACQSLLRGESTLALAGGVNLILSPKSTIAMTKFGAMSPDGRCKAFDARANGYVRGEGCGVVVLKRLSRAIADGDPIYCLILGGAINNDGFSNGLTAPNPKAQEEVLRDAYANAGVDPRTVQYVETHGPGTLLGDPIEAGALGAILGVGRPKGEVLRIGSVKTNFGHTESSAGVAGLIKVALAMRNGFLPKNLHFQSPNPHINFDALKIRVQREPEPWPDREGPQLAGVSSFGFGGTNCHLVLQRLPDESVRILPVGANDRASLRRRVLSLLDLSSQVTNDTELSGLCLAVGRHLSQGAQRRAILARTPDELNDKLVHLLGELGPSSKQAAPPSNTKPKLVFVCPGQGAQWLGMGRALLRSAPPFRAVLEACDAAIQKIAGWSVLQELTADEHHSSLSRVEVVQPLLFSIQVALGNLWRAWGLAPDIVIGHSMGEVAAAHLAGVLSLQDAARIICFRSQLVTERSNQGGMLVVGLPAEEALKAVRGPGTLTVGVYNSPISTVLSGDLSALDNTLSFLLSQGKQVSKVNVDYASHSHHMDELRERLADRLRDITPKRASTRMISTVFLRDLAGPECGPSYWAENLRQPVRFMQAVEKLLAEGDCIFLELSPHPVLSRALQEICAARGTTRPIIASTRRGEDERGELFQALCSLYERGASVRWERVLPNAPLPPWWPDHIAAKREMAPDDASLLVLSAKTPEALRAQAQRYATFLQQHPELLLSDIAFTASRTRTQLRLRLAVSARESSAALEALQAYADGTKLPGVAEGEAEDPPGKVAFLFSGQGSQRVGMGKELAGRFPVFKKALEDCAAGLEGKLPRPLLSVMWAEEGSEDGKLLDQTQYTQAALFSFEYALYQLWSSLGVEADYLLGHSIGEIVAACVAGVFPLPDALSLIATRGRLMQALPSGGAMLSIEASEEEVAPLLVGHEATLSIAAVNSPRQVVLAGAEEVLHGVGQALAQRGVRATRLVVSHAFHSPLMKPMLAEFQQAAERISFSAPKKKLISNLTGKLAGAEIATAGYWVEHARQAVRFAEGVDALADLRVRTFIELGPRATLLGLVASCLPDEKPALISSTKQKRHEAESFLGGLGAWFVRGGALDWAALFPLGGRRVQLPTYAFQRQRYWLSEEALAPQETRADHSLLGQRAPGLPREEGSIYNSVLSVTQRPYLADHQIHGAIIAPGAYYLAAALTAADELSPNSELVVEDFLIDEALLLAQETKLQLTLSPASEGRIPFQFATPEHPDQEFGLWRVHATGQLSSSAPTPEAPVEREAIQQGLPRHLSAADLYATFSVSGLEFGPTFQWIKSLWRSDTEALAQLERPHALPEGDGLIHPTLLDACIQVLVALGWEQGDASLYVPISVGTLRLRGTSNGPLWCHAQLKKRGVETRTGDVRLLDASGRVLASMEGLLLKAASQQEMLSSAKDRRRLYETVWRELGAAPPAEQPGPWMIVSDDPAAAQELRAALASAGQAVRVVLQGTGGGAQPDADVLDGTSSSELVLLLRAPGTTAPQQVLGLFTGAEACRGLLYTTQALARVGSTARLVVLTRGAQAVDAYEATNPSQSALWGLGRVIQQEHPELRCTLLDLSPELAPSTLVAELLARTTEAQLSLRNSRRFTARLVRSTASRQASRRSASLRSLLAADSYRISFTQRGALENLQFEKHERRAPGAGELEIEVQAAGLNFRDVLNVLGMYPGDPGPLGLECAGVVSRVGEGVTELQPGDAVIAVAPGSFQAYVTVDARAVLKSPAGLSAEQAATLPIAFLTAWYALHHLGKIGPGKRVLIHSAAGGVGIAAVQIALLAGAEVFATASPSKWDALRALGVRHLMNSRTSEFASEILAATGGRGVDLVLNSLTGDILRQSLRLLVPGGHFLEMGKAEILSPKELSRIRGDIQYEAFDLLALPPAEISTLFSVVGPLFRQGNLRALPLRRFRHTQYEDAFRYMAQARQIGKIVIDFEHKPDAAVNPNGTYLITGGLGGIGLRVARWLASQGARHLVLVGRSEPSDEAREAIRAIEAVGTEVVCARIDVSQRAALAELLSDLAARRPPVRGILHAAGVLADGVLLDQKWDRFQRVFAPKAQAAWHLHELTRELPLDFFVFFSSVASTLGTAGQANYAAANAFMDGLAQLRRSQGLPAISIQWGPWAGSGMAGGLSQIERQRFADLGLSMIQPGVGIEILGQSLVYPLAQVAVLPFDISVLHQRSMQGRLPPILSELIPREQSRDPSQPPASASLLQRVRDLPVPQRGDALLQALETHATRVLGLPSIHPQRPLKELGLDSLMAVELRNLIAKELETPLPATLIFDYPTLSEVVDYLLKELSLSAPEGTATPSTPTLRTADEPIAVIGIGCRFPGSSGPDAFWRLMVEGRDAITEVPATRWDLREWYDPNPDTPGKMYARMGGFVEGLESFDPTFFGISPREAPSVDPQERMLLEVSYEALEHAGIRADQILGSDTGVYMGLWSTEYQSRAFRDTGEINAYSLLGTVHSAMVGRLSYWLGLKGPNMPIDTACSSSLVAVHLACQALRNGECSLALAGGSNALISPEMSVYFSKLRAMSPTGYCHTFSDDADGYVRSEGAGVIVLKRLSDAQRDGDNVIALIRGTAVNQDGRSNGMTAPNGPSQEIVIRRALEKANLKPSDVSFVECHGTGTPLGDPIEVQALGHVFREERPSGQPVWLGSVKTNIGHTEGAAGIAGLIKVALCLQHRMIPPNLHLRELNPHIPWAELPVQPVRTLIPWEAATRVAGVSSFGFSGTNAHAILQEPPAVEPPPPLAEDSPHLLLFSAKDADALRARARQLADFAGQSEHSLPEIAAAAATTRDHFSQRVAWIGTHKRDATLALESFARDPKPPASILSAPTAPRRKAAFLFTGQGSQRVGMGKELAERFPVFKKALEDCALGLEGKLPKPLLSVMWAEEGSEDGKLLDQTQYTQAALFSFEYALYQLWSSLGVEADYLLGHSVGEIVAACVAGVFSLQDALSLVAARGTLMQALPPGGAMLSIEATAAEVSKALGSYASLVSLAAINGPQQAVIAGEEAAVLEVGRSFAARGIKTTRLVVSHAFHSPLMNPMLADFQKVAAEISYAVPRLRLVSNVSGELAGAEIATAGYWVEHVRATVRFAAGVRTLTNNGVRTLLELGPRATLLSLASACYHEEPLHLLASAKSKRDEAETMLEALGAWYCLGGDFNYGALFPVERRRVVLPTYPFQRQHYWIDAKPHATRRPGEHQFLGAGVTLSTQSHTTVWESSLSLEFFPWLADHQVQGEILFPGAAFAELALAAGAIQGAEALRGLSLQRPLRLRTGEERTIQVVVREAAPGEHEVQILSRDGASWTKHAQGVLAPRADVEPEALALAATQARLGEPSSGTSLYPALAEAGLSYGPSFQGVLELWRGAGEALGRVRLPAGLSPKGFHLHPALVDACFHVLAAALLRSAGGATWVPVELGEVTRYRATPEDVWCHVVLRGESRAGRCAADLLLVDPEGTPVAQFRGLVVQRLSGLAAEDLPDQRLLLPAWEPAEAPLALPGNERWLLLDEGTNSASALLAELTSRGRAVTIAPSSVLENADTLRAFLTTTYGNKGAAGVVLFASERPRSREASCAALLRLLQTLPRLGWRDQPRLWLVTRGAQPLDPAQPLNLEQAPILGMARVVAIEQPELRCARVDLDPARPSGEFALLAQQLLADDLEEEIAFRGQQRVVARLVRRLPQHGRPDMLLPARDIPFRLEASHPGNLSSLALRPAARRMPGPGEVTIEVEAAGLNFIDVMKALGIYPGHEGQDLELGGECAGRVVALGEGVTDFSLGQEVFALIPGSFASFVTTDARRVAPTPSGLSFTNAASLPVVFATAWYGLYHLARLQPGERVLIHSATGGTGWAAVQIARLLGAEVYATAGSDAKRDWLRAQGIQHVADSRSLAFADQIRAWTQGAGVDVVLNSLSGDAIEASLGLLAQDGRFIEIGKTDIYADKPLGLAYFRKSLSYSAVDLVAIAKHKPARLASLLREVASLIAEKKLSPVPVAVYPVSRAEDAFREMSQAKHTGKLVLSLRDEEARVRVPAEGGEIRGEGTYLLTGGLGGLGLSLAGWLVEQGARSLVLLGRHGASSPSQQAAVQALRDAGATVQVFRADAANRPQLEQVFWAIDQQLPPLRGVFHLAGFLDDGLLLQQSEERFRRVMEPKIGGAWNLHELTKERKLDQFVLYSSVASLLGSPGQGNYAAANAYLDALAHERRRMGLPALSLNWGPFSDVGMAAHAEANGARLSGRGLALLTPTEGNTLLGALMKSGEAQVGAVLLDVRQWIEVYPSAASSRVLSPLKGDAVEAPRRDASALLQELRALLGAARLQGLESFVQAQASQVLRLPAEKLGREVPLTSLGLDSLAGLELRNRLEVALGLKLPAALLWTYPTLASLASYLLQELSLTNEPAAAPVEVLAAVDTSVQIDAMTDDELAKLIADEFERI